jgi:hypothetical protein
MGHSFVSQWLIASPAMQTVHTTRVQRLEQLIDRYGSIAKLNEALGWVRTDSRLSRIRNQNQRTDREGKVFQMGDPMAREIEKTLNLDEGWMDTPPSYDLPTESPADKAKAMVAAMEPQQQYQALRLLDAIAQPEVKVANSK